MDYYSDLFDYDEILLAITYFFISIPMHEFCNCLLDNKTTGITVFFYFLFDIRSLSSEKVILLLVSKAIKYEFPISQTIL